MQDVNKIIDNISNEWANDMVAAKKRLAILIEENGRLKTEIEQLKQAQESADNTEGEAK